MTRRKRDWRAAHRKDIKEAATAAREDILKLRDLSMRARREEYGEDGRARKVTISLDGQLNLNRAALLHLQEAENHLVRIRGILEKQRERLEKEHEREIVFGPEVVEAKPKGLTRKEKREHVLELIRQVDESALATTWGRNTTFNKIGREVGVTGETARRWVREADIEGEISNDNA